MPSKPAITRDEWIDFWAKRAAQDTKEPALHIPQQPQAEKLLCAYSGMCSYQAGFGDVCVKNLSCNWQRNSSAVR